MKKREYIEYKNYLAHHGVKGMKWGVRKYVSPTYYAYKSNVKQAQKKTELAKKAYSSSDKTVGNRYSAQARAHQRAANALKKSYGKGLGVSKVTRDAANFYTNSTTNITIANKRVGNRLKPYDQHFDKTTSGAIRNAKTLNKTYLKNRAKEIGTTAAASAAVGALAATTANPVAARGAVAGIVMGKTIQTKAHRNQELDIALGTKTKTKKKRSR